MRGFLFFCYRLAAKATSATTSARLAVAVAVAAENASVSSVVTLGGRKRKLIDCIATIGASDPE